MNLFNSRSIYECSRPKDTAISIDKGIEVIVVDNILIGMIGEYKVIELNLNLYSNVDNETYDSLIVVFNKSIKTFNQIIDILKINDVYVTTISELLEFMEEFSQEDDWNNSYKTNR